MTKYDRMVFCEECKESILCNYPKIPRLCIICKHKDKENTVVLTANDVPTLSYPQKGVLTLRVPKETQQDYIKEKGIVKKTLDDSLCIIS